MCLCDFGTFFGQCISLFISCDLTMPWYPPPLMEKLKPYALHYDNEYRVIHKSVKHFKNSQQIDYSTDHGSSYAERERNSPSFFLIHISQMLNVSHLW